MMSFLHMLLYHFIALHCDVISVIQRYDVICFMFVMFHHDVISIILYHDIIAII